MAYSVTQRELEYNFHCGTNVIFAAITVIQQRSLSALACFHHPEPVHLFCSTFTKGPPPYTFISNLPLPKTTISPNYNLEFNQVKRGQG